MLHMGYLLIVSGHTIIFGIFDFQQLRVKFTDAVFTLMEMQILCRIFSMGHGGFLVGLEVANDDFLHPTMAKLLQHPQSDHSPLRREAQSLKLPKMLSALHLSKTNWPF